MLKDILINAINSERENSYFLTKVCSIAIIAISALIIVAIIEDNQREKFLKDHECKIVSKSSGNVVNTIIPSSSGNVGFGISYVPGKTGYLCNDGVIYYY